MQYTIKRSEDYLAHHGVKGMKWGVRNYQNPDGTLTPEGKLRLARSQRYVTEKRKTVGQRIRRTLGAGLIGGAVPGLAGAGLATATAVSGLASKGLLGAALASGNALSGFGTIAATGALAVAPYLAAGALGGLAIAGIKHGVQAAKVRRGQDFITAFSKTGKKG